MTFTLPQTSPWSWLNLLHLSLPHSLQHPLSSLRHHLNRRQRNLRWLNFSLFFRQLANRLSIFYLPLFLFEVAQAWSFPQELLPQLSQLQRGLVVVAVFYLIERITAVVTAIPAAKLTRHIGHAGSFLFGDLVFALFMLCLALANQVSGAKVVGSHVASSSHLFLLFPAAIFSGLKINLFWQSYRTLMDRSSKVGNLGKNLGFYKILNNLIGILAPVTGGMVIKYFGFQVLFFIGLLAVLVAVLGHLKLEVGQELDAISWQEYWRWLKERRFRQLLTSQLGKILNSMTLLLWPLYVFLLIGDVGEVGLIYSLSLLASIAINFFTGDFLDHHKKQKTPFFASGVFLSVLHLLRIGVLGIWNVVIINSLNQLIGSFHWLFFDKLIMKRGHGSQDFSFFVYRIINHSLAAMLFWILLLTFFLLVPWGWSAIFIMGALGVLLTLLAKESKE